MQQQLQRVTTQPDFLFSAGNDTYCTGTTNWINNALLNNNPAGGGPGIIGPPVEIVFQKTGSQFYSGSEESVEDLTSEIGTLGSFDGSTNPAIVYPVPQTGSINMAVRVQLRHSNGTPTFRSFQWSPTSQAGTIYTVQTSSNLTVWNTLFAVTNNGSVCTYQNDNANSSARFYRLTPL